MFKFVNFRSVYGATNHHRTSPYLDPHPNTNGTLTLALPLQCHYINLKFIKKSPANAKVNVQQQCMFESPVKQNQSPEGARRPAAIYLVFYFYSPESITCLALPTPYRLKIANFFYLPCHLAPSLEVTLSEFMKKLYGSWN